MGALRVRVVAGLITTGIAFGIGACAPTSSKSIKLPPPQGAGAETGTDGLAGTFPDEQQNGSLGEQFGLSPEEFEAGKTYTNGWAGEADEIPSSLEWMVENVAPAGETSTGSGTSTTPSNTSTGSGANTSTAPNPTNSQVVETETEVVFHIRKGTGSGAWNAKETEVVAKLGKKFTIQNDDDVPHQWHTNGTPCRHGNLIQPGQKESCQPSAKYSGDPVLYDHNTKGQFFFRAE